MSLPHDSVEHEFFFNSGSDSEVSQNVCPLRRILKLFYSHSCKRNTRCSFPRKFDSTEVVTEDMCLPPNPHMRPTASPATAQLGTSQVSLPTSSQRRSLSTYLWMMILNLLATTSLSRSLLPTTPECKGQWTCARVANTPSASWHLSK
jgi:hypothetical protein